LQGPALVDRLSEGGAKERATGGGEMLALRTSNEATTPTVASHCKGGRHGKLPP